MTDDPIYSVSVSEESPTVVRVFEGGVVTRPFRLQEALDVDMSSRPDDGLLFYQPTTQTFELRNQIDGGNF